MCPFAIAAALRVPLLSGDSVVKVRPLALLSRVGPLGPLCAAVRPCASLAGLRPIGKRFAALCGLCVCFVSFDGHCISHMRYYCNSFYRILDNILAYRCISYDYMQFKVNISR